MPRAGDAGKESVVARELRMVEVRVAARSHDVDVRAVVRVRSPRAGGAGGAHGDDRLAAGGEVRIAEAGVVAGGDHRDGARSFVHLTEQLVHERWADLTDQAAQAHVDHAGPVRVDVRAVLGPVVARGPVDAFDDASEGAGASGAQHLDVRGRQVPVHADATLLVVGQRGDGARHVQTVVGSAGLGPEVIYRALCGIGLGVLFVVG